MNGRSLLCLALAAWGIACTTTDGPTAPGASAAPVAGPPPRWTGTAAYTHLATYEIGEARQQLELEVTWSKVDNPSPAPPAGTTRYVPAGRVKARLQEHVDLGGTCTVDRAGEFAIADGVRFEGDQVLDVGADGRYQGRLEGRWDIDLVQFCPDRAFATRRTFSLRLELAGTIEGGRIQGTMPTRVDPTNPAAIITRGGSWSFAAG